MIDFENCTFRKTILKNLDELKRSMQPTANIIANLSILYEHLDNTDKKVPHENTESNSALTAEKIKLQEELSAAYKVQSQKEQELNDIERNLKSIKEKSERIQKENETLEKNRNDLCVQRAQLETKIEQSKLAKTSINDENLALMAAVVSTKKRVESIETENAKLSKKLCDLENENKKKNQGSKMDKSQTISEIPLKCENTEEELTKPLENVKLGYYIADIVPMSAYSKFVCGEGDVNDVRWIGPTEFLTGGTDKELRIWSIDPLGRTEKIKSLNGSDEAITQIDYDFDTKRMLISSNDKHIRLWNSDFSMVKLRGHADGTNCAKFYHTNLVISGSNDRMIKIWDLNHQRCIRSFYPERKVMDIVSKVGSNPANFVSGHYDKVVRIWDGRSSEQVKHFELSGRITSLCVAPNGNEVLCSTHDDCLTLLDIRNDSGLRFYCADQYHTSSDLSRCVVSPGGIYVAAGSSSGALFIWNLKTSNLEKIIQEESRNAIMSVAWNPTGLGILAATKDAGVTMFQ